MTEPLFTASQLLKRNQPHNVWKKYCGFLDLSIKEFMGIQERLLLEQIKLLSTSEIGRYLLKGRIPKSVEEFTESVPLTVYDDYMNYLDKEHEDNLPVKPETWARSSGRSDEKKIKWVPYTREMLLKVGEFAVAAFIMSACSHKGDVRIGLNENLLYTLAPSPYFSGVLSEAIKKHLNFRFMPSPEQTKELEFSERIKIGFQEAFYSGIDFFYGLSSLLVKIAEQLGSSGKSQNLSIKMLNPSSMGRMLKALLIKVFARRPLLPKDLWQVKGIVAGGMDTSFYTDKIEDLWGTRPLEGYGGTEMGGIAIQAWNRKGMTFLVDANFLEFIPEEDFHKMQEDLNFKPRTYRLDQVTGGVVYEVVVTNFNGGIFVRYKTGDLVKIISLEDRELGIDIPQMVFHARADGILDINGPTRLTEKQVWTAIESLRMPYEEWCIRKEYTEKKPVLHLYIEVPGSPALDVQEVKRLLNDSLRKQDTGYDWMLKMIESDPLEVTYLEKGSFARYIEARRKAGADLAHIKPPHLNASDTVIARLLNKSKE